MLWWLDQLNQWTENGTAARLNAAMRSAARVKVRRSSGAIEVGTLVAVGGYGGRQVAVALDGPEKRWRPMDTDKFLELNPEFGPSLIDLRPAEERG